ncbi:MAG: cardiolipin synthase [Synergistaceae bacterium]|jgi:cardiolipin synthase|nr:cardiolipin synthase [Synergistaceae bacterium]
MKKNGTVLKKFLAVAVTAFILGLSPYLWQTVPDDANFTAFIAKTLLVTWILLKNYLPHIITIYIACAAALIFFEERNPDRTILWLMTLVFLPVIGLILYTLLGPDLKRIKMRKLFVPAKPYPRIERLDWRNAPARVRKMSLLAFRNSCAEICERVGVEILVDGEATFASIKEELSKARRYVNIEYFIFKNDRLGGQIADILAERSRAGVKVRLSVDGVGGRKFSRSLKKSLQDAGVEVKTFMPVSFPFLRSGLNFRNHRKIIVIDGDTAFTGGLNIGVEYLGEGPLGHWRDTHAIFRGDAVRALNAIFLSDWKISSGEDLSPDDPQFAPSKTGAQTDLPVTPTQIVPSGSASAWRSIQQIFFLMIAEAQKRIWITSPYLAPDTAILEALKIAALSGVDTRLIIPEKGDHFLSYWAGMSNVEDLLRSGVRIWTYANGFIHAKTLIMDDAIASVGTANLDNRSLAINFEVQAFIYDGKICSILEEQFLKDFEDSNECLLPEWEKRGLGSKALESLGKLWSSQV